METEPAETPVTTPVELTVAIAGLLLLQVPPTVVSISVMVLPVHTLVGPVIVPADTTLITVTSAVAEALPQLLVTV